jgi:hypothetical protein
MFVCSIVDTSACGAGSSVSAIMHHVVFGRQSMY